MIQRIKSDYIILTLAAIIMCCSFLMAFKPRSAEAAEFSGFRSIALLEDTSSAMTYKEAASSNASFVEQYTSTIYRPRTGSALWVRLSASTPTDRSRNRFLQINNAALQEVDIYFQGHSAIHEGKKSDIHESPVQTRVWNIPIPDDYTDKDPIYARIKTTSIIWIPLRIIDSTELVRQTFLDTLFFGLFFGILISVFSVNFFFFIVMKKRVFLVYTLYMLSLIVYHLQVHGYLHIFSIPFAVERYTVWLSVLGIGIFMTIFAKSFMDLKQNLPVIYKTLNITMYAFFIQTVFGIFISEFIANRIGYVTGIIVPVIILFSAVKLYLGGMKNLRYYLLALCAMITGTLIWAGTAYIEVQIPANYFFLSGTVIEALFFTLALFAQIQEDLIEKEKMTQMGNYYKDLSRTDALTGLYNRRYLKELVDRLNTEVDRPATSALIMLDLDNFKDINDTYGHLVGDLLLTKTATKIKKHIRKTDIGCRYGGDEFLVFLSGANSDIAKSIADGIRTDILEDFSYSEEGQEIHHTISIGVTENRDDDTFDSMFLRADAALYRSKNSGRNRISVL